MNDDIGSMLKRLSDPAPPATLAASVMARVAREREESRSKVGRVAARQDRRFWLWTPGGLIMTLVVIVPAWLGVVRSTAVTSWLPGIGTLGLVPATGPGVLLLALGLLIYLAGLFAPLRR
jgi:hypothetical protein